MKKRTLIEYGFFTMLLFLLAIFTFNLLEKFTNIRVADSIVEASPKIFAAIFVLLGTKLFLELSKKIFIEVFEKTNAKYEGLLSIWNYFVWAIGIFLALSILIGNLSGFLLSIGLIGFGLTVALQTPLTCFVAWLLIITKKPFRLEDRIKIDDTIGDVVDITLLYTMIREVGNEGEPTGKLVTFPNSLLLQKSIVNYTLDTEYIWDEISVAVTYESDRELAEKVVTECVEEVVSETMKEGAEVMRKLSKSYGAISRGMQAYIHSTPQIRISLGDSWFNVTARYICKIRERRKIKTEISRKILDKFKSTKGIEIAYPHIEIITKEKS
ncbi:MAG: mechanosensitive ion channel [Candidatus Altiarchaeota archaeon]